MKYRRRLIGLIVSMTTVSWLVAPVAIYLLLRTPFALPALITLAVVLFLNLWGMRWLLRLSGALLRRLQEQDGFQGAIQELEQERKFISNLLDTAPSLIVLLDLEGRIVLFNRAGPVRLWATLRGKYPIF